MSPPSPPSSEDRNANAWEAFFPKGSYKPSGPIKGGFGFYLAGPVPFSRMLMNSETVEVMMGYDVLFEEGFDWVKGGKLPGIFGGVGDHAYRCTGGRQEDRCKCFDFRLMFRGGGEGELYAYAPLAENNAKSFLSIPQSRQNMDYGISVGRGLFKFCAGVWTSIAIRVKLNEPGVEDGQVELYIDGISVIHVTSLTLRHNYDAHIKGMHFQTFFGGSTPDWAATRDQRAWFASMSGAIIRRSPE